MSIPLYYFYKINLYLPIYPMSHQILLNLLSNIQDTFCKNYINFDLKIQKYESLNYRKAGRVEEGKC